MEVIEMLFGNAFFQLPPLEAMTYIVVVLMIGAGILGIVSRLAGDASQPVEYREELGKAA